MRSLAFIALVGGLAVAAFLVFAPEAATRVGADGVARLLWLLAAAALVGGGAFSLARARSGGGRRALIYLAIWAALIAGLVLAFQIALALTGDGRVNV